MAYVVQESLATKSLIVSNPTAAAATDNAFLIDQNANGRALEIDSESTTANIIQISNPTATTGHIFNAATCDSLTTGVIVRAYSNSSDSSARRLIDVKNDHASATGCIPIYVDQDAVLQAVSLDVVALAPFIDFVGTTGGTNTASISTLTTSGATTHHIQIEINGTKAWIAASTTNPS